jgi:hypothetical protein
MRNEQRILQKQDGARAVEEQGDATLPKMTGRRPFVTFVKCSSDVLDLES